MYIVSVVRTLKLILASGALTTACLATIAEYYPVLTERSTMVSYMLTSVQLGYQVGPIYGGTLYDLTNTKMWPFILFAIIIIINVIMFIIAEQKAKSS